MFFAAGKDNNVRQDFASEIEIGEYADLLAQGEVLEELDIGSAMICKVSHPIAGLVTLLNTSAGHAAMLR